MKQITLEELPRYSVWPAKLLDLEPAGDCTSNWQSRYERTYGQMLAAYKEHPNMSIPQLLRMEIGYPENKVAISLQEGIYSCTLEEAAQVSDRYIRDAVFRWANELEVKSVVDLGCGWGRLMVQLRQSVEEAGWQKSLVGAELSASGVSLAQSLYKLHQGLVFPYDLTSARPCQALAVADEPMLVTTSFACHQLATAAPVIDLLARWRDKISVVVTFEPEESEFGKGLLGLMRKRYSQVRGYSADTFTVLNSRKDVEILEYVPNAVGTNALLPGSLGVWRFQQ